jgi:GNAT superfamily N-acetyltransferase
MRLTHVAHLRLPFGRILGYDLDVGPSGERLPVSFDQDRHVGAGDRPGSWMAITIRVPELDLDALAEAWLSVVQRHGTLRSVFTPGPDGPELHDVEVGPGSWREHPVASGSRLSDAVRGILDEHCTPYSRPSHRLCVVRSHDRSTVVVAADHAHVDMWSLLVVVRDLLDALTGREPAPLPRPFADHTAALVAREQAPQDVRDRWREVIEASGGVMPTFPLPLGDVGTPVPERVELRDVLDVDALAWLARAARRHEVSTLALVTSVLTDVTRRLADLPLRAVFPVHSRYEDRWHDSVGWFITNAVLDSDDPDPTACAAAVKEAVRLGSWPLAEVLAPWGGMPQAPGMFAISWLDLRRLPVRVDHVGLEAQYVSAAGTTDGVMLWFVLDEAGMHLRCRYPDTEVARATVGAWLDAVVDGIRLVSRDAGWTLPVDGVELRVERARRGDLAAVAAMLADDPLGATRESPDLAAYEEAFDALVRDTSQLPVVVREGDTVVATAQLTIIPGLSRGGATRLQVEGVRVASPWRRRGLGRALLEWAHEHGRARGAVLSQLTTDSSRVEAHRFYERLGYEATHLGLKRPL